MAVAGVRGGALKRIVVLMAVVVIVIAVVVVILYNSISYSH